MLERKFGAYRKKLLLHREEPDMGLDEKGCLKQWVMLCGLTAIDPYLMSFIQDEVKLYSREVVQELQQLLCDLINHYLKNEMPMDDLNPRLSFVEENIQARNASEALLVLLSSCVAVTHDSSDITWPTKQSFKAWLSKLWSDSDVNEPPIALRCLSYLNLSEQCLDGARLDRASLMGAILDDGVKAYCRSRVALVG